MRQSFTIKEGTGKSLDNVVRMSSTINRKGLTSLKSNQSFCNTIKVHVIIRHQNICKHSGELVKRNENYDNSKYENYF